ncbi:MAG: M48 family metalloprotease [candidate division WOR-3 bacterium]
MPGRTTLYGLIDRNKRNTVFFIILFTIILALVGYVLGQAMGWGTGFYLLFGLFIVAYNLILYYNSDKLALAVSGARPADSAEFRQLHNVVEEVAIAAGVPKPRVYIIESDMPNAFATGRNPQHASIAVTRGLLELMNRDELQGVVAHEMAHIKNYDILLMTVVAIIGGLLILFRDVFLRWGLWGGGSRRRSSSRSGGQLGIIMLAAALVLAILAPLLVALIRAAVSRQREYLADASGALIVRNPDGLASALTRLGNWRGKMAGASQATAHLFIASPFGQDRRESSGPFDSHPPLSERVRRLRELTIP